MAGVIIVIDSDKWFSKKWINGNYTHKENLRLEDEGGNRFVPKKTLYAQNVDLDARKSLKIYTKKKILKKRLNHISI